MLLSDAVPSPSDAGDAYDDTARVELALEALAGRGGLDLGGFKSDADVLVAVSGAAARWVAGDCRVIAPILAFLKDALAGAPRRARPAHAARRRSSPSGHPGGARGARTRQRPKHGVHEPYARCSGGVGVVSSPSAAGVAVMTSPPPRARRRPHARRHFLSRAVSLLGRRRRRRVDAAGSDDAGSLAGWVARAHGASRTASVATGGVVSVRRARFARRVAHGVRAESSRVRAAWSSRASIFDSPPRNRISSCGCSRSACAFPAPRWRAAARRPCRNRRRFWRRWRRVCCCAISRRGSRGCTSGTCARDRR